MSHKANIEMNAPFKRLDNLRLKDLERYRRLYSSRLPLNGLGYTRHEKVDTKGYRTKIDFHLFLNGKGFAYIDGKKFVIRENTVAVFFTDVNIRHCSRTGWEVFWMNFDPQYAPVLHKIIGKRLPVWRLKSPEHAIRIFHDICQYAAKTYEYGFADRLDRMAETMLMECIVGRKKRKYRKNSEDFSKIIEFVESHYLDDFNLSIILKKFGISRPLFFQRWRQYISIPPKRYAMQLRINEACQLLTSSHLRISEIAQTLNFKDVLYFSRKFRQLTGMTATEYRKKYFGNIEDNTVVP